MDTTGHAQEVRLVKIEILARFMSLERLELRKKEVVSVAEGIQELLEFAKNQKMKGRLWPEESEWSWRLTDNVIYLEHADAFLVYDSLVRGYTILVEKRPDLFQKALEEIYKKFFPGAPTPLLHVDRI